MMPAHPGRILQSGRGGDADPHSADRLTAELILSLIHI